MIRFCHFSDLHLMHHKPFFEEHVDLLSKAIKDAGEQKLSFYAFVGDFSGFDAPHKMHTSERLALARLMKEAASYSRVFMVGGNHDDNAELELFWEFNEDQVPPYAIMPFYHLADPQQDARSLNNLRYWGNTYVGVLPWRSRADVLKTIGKLPVELENIEASNKLIQRFTQENMFEAMRLFDACPPKPIKEKILLCHAPVAGGKIGDFELKTSTDILFHPEQFEGFDYVALGHYHERQQVAENAWYCGSPVPLSHAETTQKGYHIVEIDEGQTKVHFQPIDSWKMKTIHLEWKDNKFTNYDEINFEAARTYVKVKITSHGVLGGWNRNEVIDKLKSQGALGVDVQRESVVYQNGLVLVEKEKGLSLAEKVQSILQKKMGIKKETALRLIMKLENLKNKLPS